MKKEISNWGNYPTVKTSVTALEFEQDVRQFVGESASVLARGNGRCYGDAALSDNVFSTLKLDKITTFDVETGLICCQSGVLLSQIIELVLPKGFFLPVTPGTKFITIGGAIAADVHGKNHHSEGCFSDHVLWFDLIVGNGEMVRCSKSENTDLFWQTVGGMGLTGVIFQACFQLKKVETAYIRQEAIQAKNLTEVMQIFESSSDWTYTVSWIDCLKKGRNLGRSIMLRGEHATVDELPQKIQANPLIIKPKLKLTVPFYLPKFTINPLTVKAFNFLYYHKEIFKKSHSIIDYDSYFYPLDGILNWNRIYGKSGFVQYQFVLPLKHSEQGLVEILETIQQQNQGSFLTVLKLFGKANPLAIQSFPMKGYTLAIDFKVNDGLPKLIQAFDEIIGKYNGRIYRAKDAMSKKELMPLTITKSKFQSTQSKRIDY